MTTVETIGRIRRAYFVHHQSVREISRRLHVSRKTVRKAIEAEDGEFSYERATQPMPKLGAHVAELERLMNEQYGLATPRSPTRMGNCTARLAATRASAVRAASRTSARPASSGGGLPAPGT